MSADLFAVKADEELLAALGSGELRDDDALAELLAAWRCELDDHLTAPGRDLSTAQPGWGRARRAAAGTLVAAAVLVVPPLAVATTVMAVLVVVAVADAARSRRRPSDPPSS